MNNIEPEIFRNLKKALLKQISNVKEVVDEDWYIYIINKSDIISHSSSGKRIECYFSKDGSLEYYKEEQGELGEMLLAGCNIGDFKWEVKKILYGDSKMLWDRNLIKRVKQHPLLNANEDWMVKFNKVNSYK